MRSSFRRLTFVTLIAVVLCASANAGLITITGVNCTAQWSTDFPCTATFDGDKNDYPKDVYPTGYWLGRGFTSNETLTFDLGGQYSVSSIILYNTHNRDYNDRGTQDFAVWISSTPVVPDTNPVSTFGTQVLTGTLAFYTFDSPNTAQGFTLVSPTTGRYVTFRAESYVCPTGNCGAGLSEIEVSGDPAGIPEPGAMSLVGIGAIMLLVVRRRLAAR